MVSEVLSVAEACAKADWIMVLLLMKTQIIGVRRRRSRRT